MRALRVILGQLAQIVLFPLVNVIVHEFFLQKGVARGIFSNEAGLGTASIVVKAKQHIATAVKMVIQLP